MFIFKVSNIICDAPARAFVKAVKGHNAYHGCDKCTQTSEYIGNKMTFPELQFYEVMLVLFVYKMMIIIREIGEHMYVVHF